MIPGIVQMDRVSNITKWLADKDDGRGLTKDEWISVEEFIPGKDYLSECLVRLLFFFFND